MVSGRKRDSLHGFFHPGDAVGTKGGNSRVGELLAGGSRYFLEAYAAHRIR